MTKYKCGHIMDIIIEDDSLLTTSAWLAWKDSAGFEGDKSQCFECWQKS